MTSTATLFNLTRLTRHLGEVAISLRGVLTDSDLQRHHPDVTDRLCEITGVVRVLHGIAVAALTYAVPPGDDPVAAVIADLEAEVRTLPIDETIGVDPFNGLTLDEIEEMEAISIHDDPVTW